MSAIRFNPLTYSRILQDSGLSEKTSDAIAQEQTNILSEFTNKDSCHKEDISGIKDDIHFVKLEIGCFKQEMKLLEQRMIIKLGSLIVVGIGILSVIIKS